MTVEAAIMNKNAFDFFVNGGVLFSRKSRNDAWGVDLNPSWADGTVYIQNDGYISIRKQISDGAIIEARLKNSPTGKWKSITKSLQPQRLFNKSWEYRVKTSFHEGDTFYTMEGIEMVIDKVIEGDYEVSEKHVYTEKELTGLLRGGKIINVHTGVGA